MFTTPAVQEPEPAPWLARRDADLLFRLVGFATLALAAWVPWVTSSWAGAQHRPRLVDLPATRWAVAVLAIAVLVTTVLEWFDLVPREPSRAVAIVASTVLTVVPVLSGALIELIGIWLSPERLPRTVRRLAVGADPMPGLWFTSIAGAVCLIGATEQGRSVIDAAGALASGARERSEAAISSVILVVAVPLLVLARYGEWFGVRSSAGDWSIPGWSLPWYGIGSLVLIGATIAIGGAAWVRPSTGKATALAVVGWLITLPAGLTTAIAAPGPTLTAPRWVRERLESAIAHAEAYRRSSPVALPKPKLPSDLGITLVPGRGAIATYAGGILVIIAGVLLARSTSKGTEP